MPGDQRRAPQYRFFSTDILTGAPLAELPLYGVWLTRKLCEAGAGTGTCKLGSGYYSDRELLNGTVPGKTALYVERDGTIIWGGIIWSRTWDEAAHNINLTIQTFESIFNHVILERDFVHQAEDQMKIFKAVIDAIQSQENNDFSIDTSNIGKSGVLRTVLIPGYEYHYAQDAVDQLIGVEDGFDYTIDILPGQEVDSVRKVVRAGYPSLGSREASRAVYDYPGNIDTFWYPESATRSGTKFAGMGNGSGIGMVRATRHNRRLLNAGYPGWWLVKSWKGVTDQSILNELVAEQMNMFSTPVAAPTFRLKSDAIPEFDRWNDLGAQFDVHIESDRFPDGMDTTSRMIGWELHIADAGNVEMLTIMVEGDRDDV